MGKKEEKTDFKFSTCHTSNTSYQGQKDKCNFQAPKLL